MKRELSTSRFLAFNLLSPTMFGTVLQCFAMFCRPCGALFSQLQQSFYSEDQLALQETTKKLVEEVV